MLEVRVLPGAPFSLHIPELAPIELSTKKFGRIAKSATVPGNGTDGFCRLHDLRRAFGSRWADKVPAPVLMRLMRHADISTTMTYYVDTEDAAVAAIWPGT